MYYCISIIVYLFLLHYMHVRVICLFAILRCVTFKQYDVFNMKTNEWFFFKNTIPSNNRIE